MIANGCVAARGVIKEGIKTDRRVEVAAGLAKERARTDRCVIDPIGAEAIERTPTRGGIVVTIYIL